MVLPLFITSSLFVIPCVIGFRKKHVRDATVMAVLTVLSLWNHGTNSAISLIIDRAYAHVFATCYGVRALLMCLWRRRAVDFVVFGIYGCGVAMYAFEMKELVVPLHAGLHACTVSAFSLHMLTKR